jgi:hypothetical protein
MLHDPGRVRSQMTSVVCQIQRFDFASAVGSSTIVGLGCMEAKELSAGGARSSNLALPCPALPCPTHPPLPEIGFF